MISLHTHILTVKWGIEIFLLHRVVIRIEYTNIYKDLRKVSMIKVVDPLIPIYIYIVSTTVFTFNQHLHTQTFWNKKYHLYVLLQ